MNSISKLSRCSLFHKARSFSSSAAKQYRVVIVGGGSAGITVASQLGNKLSAADKESIAIVEPAEFHYYQPWWTMAGGGIVPVEGSRKTMAEVMPNHVKWIQKRCGGFEPESNEIVLDDGSKVGYDYLIVAAGIQININGVAGLSETIGKNGVSSIYDYRYAPSTWNDIQATKKGRALFTQPTTPIKCGGAPQKIMWLAEDWWRNNAKVRDNVDITFMQGMPSMFPIKKYSDALDDMRKKRGVGVELGHNLVEVDGGGKMATFEKTSDKTRVTEKFDMLHVTPPMSSPDFIKKSQLADAAGWVEVNKDTTQHVRYPNVFSIGDCSSLPTSKTAAAVASQAPVVVHNLQKLMEKGTLNASYDGYTSCPILTGRGSLVLAEFKGPGYGGAVSETFPFVDQSKEHLFGYHMKRYVFPLAYWNFMLKGKWFGNRTFFEPKF